MIINKNIKLVWKFLMKPFLRLYSCSPKLIIENTEKFFINKKHYSQFGQDLFVLEDVFKNKKNGFFVDIGGNHPTSGNNTYLLELNGWRGLAVEPQEYLRLLWQEKRQTECLHFVIGDSDNEVIFVEGEGEEHGLSGVENYSECKDGAKKIKLKQRTLKSILSERNIIEIDYLSIDVEGYELQVLKGIDFSRVNIKIIGLENDNGFCKFPVIGKRLGSEFGNNQVRKFLKKKGYKYIARVFCDDFFIKE